MRSTRTSGKGKKAATTTKQAAAKKSAKNGGGKGATSKAGKNTKRATNNTKAKGKGTKKALGKHNPNIESDEEIEDDVPTKKEKTTRATRSRKVCGVVYYFNHGLYILLSLGLWCGVYII